MKQTIFSLHKITSSQYFGFYPEDYSRFKFGDDRAAQKFGTALASDFIKQHLERDKIQTQMVVISSPYSFIPTATFALKNHFVFALNRWLADNDLPIAQEAKVHRTVTYKEDHGELDAAQRMKLIGNDTFHIDRAFLEGKTLLFLDDIKITGSHEKMICKMIDAYRLKNETYLLYFAELENKSIHPNIENFLNYYTVKSIFDLTPIICESNFQINTRLVKYVLNSKPEEFVIFIDSQSNEFIQLLYNMSLGNSYHRVDQYEKNLQYIKRNFITGIHKTIQHGN